MDTSIPFYLRKDFEAAKPVEQTPLVDFNYDYSYLDGKKTADKSFWQGISDSVDNGVQTVFDPIKQTWVEAKKGISDLGQTGLGFVEKAVDVIKNYFLWILLGFVVVVYVVGKSGIVGQASGFVKPF